MKKTILAAALGLAVSSTSFAQGMPSADQVKQLMESQAGDQMTALYNAGTSIKDGRDAMGCYMVGQTQTGMTYLAMMAMQIMMGGMADPSQAATVKDALNSFGRGASFLQNGAMAFCNLTNITDADRKVMLSNINQAGKGLEAVAAGRTWTDL